MLITISRQFAAGGSQVASRVAEALGWRLVDDELVDKVAERAGVSREEVAALEERAPTFIERLARLTALELPELFLPTAEAVEEFGEGHLVKITRALVEELAAEGRCVVVGSRVGRGAGAQRRHAPRPAGGAVRDPREGRGATTRRSIRRCAAHRRRARRQPRPLSPRVLRPRLQRPDPLPHGAQHRPARVRRCGAGDRRSSARAGLGEAVDRLLPGASGRSSAGWNLRARKSVL